MTDRPDCTNNEEAKEDQSERSCNEPPSVRDRCGQITSNRKQIVDDVDETDDDENGGHD
jgi:hypothetical protein